MIVYDPAHFRLELGAPEHEGGEGWICRIVGQPGKLAKIFKPQRQSGREIKLRWMISNPPSDPGRLIGHASIAWPQTLLYDEHGNFAGYVMSEITGTCKMLNVLNPHLRARTFTSFDGYHLYRVARNLATAIGVLHARDYVIGDLNESNLLVTPEALVTVIDTDSFQVRVQLEGQIIFYPCPVGRPEFTPPELQEKKFRGEVRQPEQDAFAMAVLIFQLLMEGSHPFRATWLGGGDPPPVEERISLGLFPYNNPATAGLVAPPPNYSLDRLHPPLADLMRRCFIDGHNNPRKRPLPPEWESVLRAAETSLITCPHNHLYSAHLAQCPQCGAKPPLTHLPAVKSMHVRAVVHAPQAVPAPAKANLPQAAPAPAPPPPQVTCPSCTAVIPAGEIYCPKCASPIDPQTCRHCGFARVPKMAVCCPKCGKTP